VGKISFGYWQMDNDTKNFEKEINNIRNVALPIVEQWKENVDAVMCNKQYNINLCRVVFSRLFDEMMIAVYNNHALERNEQGD
jgi:hypothetical protein